MSTATLDSILDQIDLGEPRTPITNADAHGRNKPAHGRPLSELAKEITRQTQARKDYIVPGKMLAMAPVSDGLGKAIVAWSEGDSARGFTPNQVAHEQFGEKAGIPKKYYDRMLNDAPDLLASNVNRWIQGSNQKYMVRTIGETNRALLSDRYRPLDNYDLCEAVLPIIGRHNADVVSCEVTDRRMYLKAVVHSVQREVRKGDVVEAGICVSNSEVGCGALNVEPYVLRLVCLNGARVKDQGIRKVHIGRSNGASNGQPGMFDDYAVTRSMLTDATKIADDKAFFLKVQDVAEYLLRGEFLDAVVADWKRAAGEPLPNDVQKVVEVTAKRLSLTETEEASVLSHLIRGADLSRYGLLNAVTRTAQDATDYDRASEIELLGPTVIGLNLNN